MSGLNTTSWRKFEQFLAFVGCKFVRERGDHRVWGRQGLQRPVIIPKEQDIPVFILRNNLRVLNVSVAEYLDIINRL